MSTSETQAGHDVEAGRGKYAARGSFDARDPEALEHEINATRQQVRADLDALEHRLSFDRLVELTLGRVRERGGEFAGNLGNAATQNPVPLLLTTIGVGWMMLLSRRNGDPRASTGSRQAANGHGFAEQVGGAAGAARETLERTAEAVRESSSRAAETATEQMEHARERIDRLIHEQPLLLGALGLAAGALIGALLPATGAEDRWLGEARKKAVGDFARTGRKRYEAAREHSAAYSAPASESEPGAGPARAH